MISLAATVVGNSFIEKLVFGLQASVIGVVMVSVLLSILIFILKGFELISNIKIKKPKNSKKNIATEDINAISTPVTPEITVDSNINYDETVVAIIGALSVVLSADSASYIEENPNAKFIVKSIKKFNSRRF